VNRRVFRNSIEPYYLDHIYDYYTPVDRGNSFGDRNGQSGFGYRYLECFVI
jgi:hypothetical protein